MRYSTKIKKLKPILLRKQNIMLLPKILINFFVIIFIVLSLLYFSGCATTDTQSVGRSFEIELPPYTSTGNEPKVAIIDFQNGSFFESQTLGPGVAMMFQTALVRSRRFRVIERENLLKILNEQKLDMAGVTTGDISKIGHLVNVDYIITGKVTEFGVKKTGTSVGAGAIYTSANAGGGSRIKVQKGTARIAIDIKFIDVHTGQIVWMGTAVGKASSGNVGLGFGLLTQTGAVAAASIAHGVQGFDETIAGKAARVSAYQMVNQIVKENVFNWSK